VGDSQPRRLEERIARELGLIVLMVALALLQVTLFQLPLGFPVPIVLIAIICRTVIGTSSAFPDSGVSVALRWALYAGLTLDLLTTTPIGSHPFALLITATLVALTTRRLSAERIFIPLLATLCGALIYEAILALLILPQPIDWSAYARVVLLPTMLIAIIPALPIFFMMRWALRRQI
jgi:rod shape-determining protein MreD